MRHGMIVIRRESRRQGCMDRDTILVEIRGISDYCMVIVAGITLHIVNVWQNNKALPLKRST